MVKINGSDTLKAIGYDAENKVMHVQFRSGAIYEYQNVTHSDHQELMAAKKKGRMFRRVFLSDPDRFPFKRLPAGYDRRREDRATA